MWLALSIIIDREFTSQSTTNHLPRSRHIDTAARFQVFHGVVVKFSQPRMRL